MIDPQQEPIPDPEWWQEICPPWWNESKLPKAEEPANVQPKPEIPNCQKPENN